MAIDNDSYVDAVLAEAAVNSAREGFKPDTELLNSALGVLFCLDSLVKEMGVLSEEEQESAEIGIGIILAHLDHAYPGITVTTEQIEKEMGINRES